MTKNLFATRHIQTVFAVAAFFSVSFLIYANTLHSPLVFDDYSYIIESQKTRLTGLSIEAFREFLSQNKDTPYNNRPVALITLALNYYFHTYTLPGYHIVNILIHALTGIFLFFLFRFVMVLSGRNAYLFVIPFLAALLWLVHPLHTESVTYILQRMTSMGAMFCVLAQICYIKGRCMQRGIPLSGACATNDGHPMRWFTGCGVAMLLAFGSKENTAMLPFLIILTEWYFFQDVDSRWLKRAAIPILLFFIVVLVLAFVYRGGNPIEKMLAGYQTREFTLAQRVMTEWRVVVYYLSLLALPFPSRLTLEHDYPLSMSIGDPFTTALSLIAIIGLTVTAIYTARGHRLFSFCILWFLLNLVIESSVIELEIIFEHRTYLPSMLIALIAVTGLFRLVHYKKPAISLILLITAVFAAFTFVRNRDWQDTVTLYKDCVQKAPNKNRIYNNLAKELIDRGENKLAIKHLSKVLLSKPDPNTRIRTIINMAAAHTNLKNFDVAYRYLSPLLSLTISGPEKYFVHYAAGKTLLMLGRREEAREELNKAHELNPADAAIIETIAQCHLESGDKDKTIDLLQQALRIDPRAVSAHTSLGALFYEKGDTEQAIRHFEQAIQLNPRFSQALFNMGLAVRETQGPEKAMEYLMRALIEDPRSAKINYEIGLILLEQKKTDQAIGYLRKAIDLKPGFAMAAFQLGKGLFEAGRKDDAIACFRDAIKYDPQLIEAYLYAGNLLVSQGKAEEAARCYADGLKKDPESKALKQNLTLLAGQIIEKYESILAETPSNVNLRFALGNFHLTIGDNAQAALQFEKILEVAPDSQPAMSRLAGAYWNLQEYGKAALLFEKMAGFNPGQPSILYNVACAYSRANQAEQAFVWIQKAIGHGYDKWDKIETDPDLENLRKSEWYGRIQRPAGKPEPDILENK